MDLTNPNKRIAINTAYMYIRLFITLAIGLYTSRVVFLVLGISDYGLFNVVGGILAMFTFISGSLSAATTRFFNVEMGKPNGNLNQSYNINLSLHIGLAIITLLLAETIGIWYVYNKLNVPAGQLSDAVFIFHLSILSACIGIVSGPCMSLFSAFERFGFLAKFDIINTIIRLIGVILLQYYNGNALRFYSILMCVTSVNSLFVYYWFANKYWPEILKIKIVTKWREYCSVISFGGWNLLSTVALMVRNTGSDLIINHFFSTAMNGAFAISKTVNTYVTTYSSNFDSASGPQIVQSFSAGDLNRCSYLVNKMGRFCILLFELVFFPLYIELDFILHIWLKDVPENVLIFCQYNLLLAGVALTCGGLVQVINASGKIKWFKINGSLFFVLCLPIGYWLYVAGAPAYSMLFLFLVADIIQRVIQLILMKYVIGFNSMLYAKEAYGRPALIAIVMILLLWVHSLISDDTIAIKVISIVFCAMVTGYLVYTIGLTKGERNKVINSLQRKMSLFHR